VQKDVQEVYRTAEVSDRVGIVSAWAEKGRGRALSGLLTNRDPANRGERGF